VRFLCRLISARGRSPAKGPARQFGPRGWPSTQPAAKKSSATSVGRADGLPFEVTVVDDLDRRDIGASIAAATLSAVERAPCAASEIPAPAAPRFASRRPTTDVIAMTQRGGACYERRGAKHAARHRGEECPCSMLHQSALVQADSCSRPAGGRKSIWPPADRAARPEFGSRSASVFGAASGASGRSSGCWARRAAAMVLAAARMSVIGGAPFTFAVIPGRCEASNPEVSRHSGLVLTHHPGMTKPGLLR